jgi:hypothetical protein
MSAVSRGPLQSCVELVAEENACQAHAHTLEVLHQWQALQSSIKELAPANEHAAPGDSGRGPGS